MLTKKFTTTIQIDSDEMHLNIDKVIMGKLTELFENKCYDSVVVKKILSIFQRGNVVFSRNHFPTAAVCNVIFEASFKSFNKSEYIALKVTFVDQSMIICDSVDHVAHLDISELPNAKIGSTFLGIILHVDYHNNSKVVFRTIPYFKPTKTQVVRVVNEIDENFIEAIEKINFSKIKKSPAYKYFDGKSKFTFDSFDEKNYRNVDKLEKGEVLFVISPHNWINTFYIAPIGAKLNADGEVIIKTTSLNIYHMIYKHFSVIYNVLLQLEELDENILNFNK